MRNLILLVFAVAALGACKKKKDDTTPPSTKNEWDGRYRMEGTMTDHSDPSFHWLNNSYEYTLQTSGTNTDSLVANALGFPGIVVANTGSSITNATFYGKFGLVITFDAAAKKVTSVTNYYGQPSSGGFSAALDPTGANSVDAATKNIKIKFFMDQTGVVGHRATFDVTLVYLGARP